MLQDEADTPTPFSLPTTVDKLRSLLPPIARATDRLPQALARFCAIYGIDFGRQREDVRHYMGVIASADERLCTHVYRRAGATQTLLLIHGYLDHSGLYKHLIGWALDQGYDVVMFDLPGHGLSSGEPAAIADFKDYADALAAVVGACQLDQSSTLVMAQSTGCAALMEYARHYDWPFQRTVMLAPLLRPVQWTTVWWAHLFLGGLRRRVPRQFQPNSGNTEFLDFIKNDPLQSQTLSVRWVGALKRWLRSMKYQPLGVDSLLIVQGDKDNTVDWRWNLPRLLRLFPRRQLMILKGGRHHLANETVGLRMCYLRVVEDYLKPQ